MCKSILYIISLFSVITTAAQKLSAEEYIKLYKDVAITEMKRMGVPAAITLAQGILESESGNSDLVKRSNNHFGIKCKNTWTGETVFHDDDANGECFRAYKTADESYRDHSNFLRNNTRYGALFKLVATDYRGWAVGLKRAGYATNPSYPDILIRNIEQYNLQQYTLAAVNDVPVFDASKYKDDQTEAMLADSNTINTADSTIESIIDHPNKIISINHTNCILATKGTSLSFIAIRNKINLNKLLEYNELAEDGILGKSQYIFLQKKPRVGEQDDCIMQEGQTAYDIAQQYGIQMQYLLDYNGISNEVKIPAGTKLVLRPVKKIMNRKENTASNKIYQVVPKDGLFSIAKKYGVTVQQLMEWNKLESTDVRIGQQLIISK